MLEQLAGTLTGSAAIVVALLIVARVMWMDARYTRGLEARVHSLESALALEQGRRQALIEALVSQGIPIPQLPEPPLLPADPEVTA